MRKTERGFDLYSEFIDTYQSKVSIQMSSNVKKRCVITVTNDGKHPRSNLVTDGFMHLSEAQARRVIKALEKFLLAP